MPSIKKSSQTSAKEKILFAQSGISKQDLLDYYRAIAPLMLPLMRNRLISMERFPHSIAEGFYQKNVPDYFPAWLPRIRVARKIDGSVDYTMVNSRRSLLYLTSQHCISYHLWLSQYDHLETPDRLIFDLDPAHEASFSLVKEAAWQLKELLDQINLHSYPLLTGSRGIHLYIPLRRTTTFDETHQFAHEIAAALVANSPKKFTLELSKEKRGNKIFIDWLRNGFGATAIAPYSVRAREGAPIATPISWQEFEDKELAPQRYTITMINDLLERPNPWQNMQRHKNNLAKARILLKGI